MATTPTVQQTEESRGLRLAELKFLALSPTGCETGTGYFIALGPFSQLWHGNTDPHPSDSLEGVLMKQPI